MVNKYKYGDIVIINRKRYKVLLYDGIASRIYGTKHYRCRLMGRRCTDSYPENLMKM